MRASIRASKLRARARGLRDLRNKLGNKQYATYRRTSYMASVRKVRSNEPKR